MKLYLSHPSLSKKEIRIKEKELEDKTGLELLNPFYDIDDKWTKLIDNNILSGPFDDKIDPLSVVKTNLSLIDESDGLLCIIDDKSTIGTFMELFYAKRAFKPIITICINRELRFHPWLKYCSDVIFGTYEEYIEYWCDKTEIKNTNLTLCGEKRSGKDTVARYLVDNYGFKQFAFADEIKTIAKSLFLLSDNEIDNKNDYIRKLLQDIGDKIKLIDENIFIDSVIKKINRYRFVLPKEYNRVVISDSRLHNEIKYLKLNNFISWKLLRTNFINNDTHRTETEVKEIETDIELLNDNMIKDLYKKVDKEVLKLL